MLTEQQWLQRGLAKQQLAEQARLRVLRGGDMHAYNRYKRSYDQAIGRLNRLKRDLRPKVSQALQRLQRIMGVTVPKVSVLLIEDKINNSGLLEKIIKKRFKDESADGTGGDKWAQLKPATIAARKRHSHPGAHPILVETGALKAAAISYVAGTDRVAGFKWNAADIGIDYAEYANEDRPFMNLPTALEMEPIRRKVKELARKAAADYFRRQLRGQQAVNA